MSTNRADPFDIDVDLSEFTPKSVKKPAPPRDAIRAVSEANNFPSRSPVARKVPPDETAAERVEASPAPKLPAQRRRRTGRNVQFNIKATSETIERFVAISDAQNWVFGETLENALDALESQLKTKRAASRKS